jgi:hypothetical protein
LPIESHRDTLRLLVYIPYLCDQVLKVLHLSSAGSLALLSAHFSCELLSTNRPSTLTLTAEAEVLKLHESCYQLCSYLKPVSSKFRRGSPLSIEDLSNISPPLCLSIRQPQHLDATWRGPRLQNQHPANASFPKPSLSHHCAQITRLPDEESPSIIPCLTTASRSALSLALILACTLKSPWFALPHLLMTV